MTISTDRPARDAGVRLAEVIAALSIATDLGMGQPLEYALSSCMVAVRLGDALGLSADDLRAVFYQALLRYIGCNAETYAMAAIVGDEIALRRDFATVDNGKPPEVISLIIRSIRQANAGASPMHLTRSMLRGLLSMPQMKDAFTGHCEVAQRLAERLGFGDGIIRALGQLYERWDGKGLPAGLKGEQIAVAVRVVTLAQDAVTFHRIGGTDAAVAVARERSGAAYDPRMAECFVAHASHLCAGLCEEPSWESILALEPGGHPALTEEEFDAACLAIADFADLKSPYTLNHSRGVAALAAEGARRCGLPDADARALERAGLLHDIGRVGLSAAVWGKPGPLSEREWERVRMHPYYTERVLARPAALARYGALASLHHERLDGSGYYRGALAAQLAPAARILAAADVYHAMTEPRPHRPARPPEEAAEELRREVRAGRLDGDAADGVLAAAGHCVPPARREHVAGLTAREIEVLRLLARGNATREIATRLFISTKTADNHIQHIYAKTGVTTRAGATLFAMEHDVLAGA